jgi:glycosyltransferase involved in cell wall biosynthesis
MLTTGDRGENAVDRSVSPRAARPIRVLFINDTSRNGGPGSTLFYILKFMDAGKIHRSVVVPRDGIVAERFRTPGVCEELWLEPNLIENIVEPWGRAIERDDFDAPALTKTVRAIGNVGRATAGMLRLAARVRRGRYDAIFCNGTTANFAGAALGGMVGVPVVWHVFYTELAGALVPLHARLAASDAVKAMLCVSKPTARLFDSCAPEKVRIVHDSIDTTEFTDGPRVLRSELGIPTDTVVFGSQGRILPRKGYVEMIRAARIALDRLTPDERARCRFVVLGDTPQDTPVDHLAECRALVNELRLEREVSLLGFRPDVKPYVRDFDVVVVPSIYEDPLPRSLFEAMALDKPLAAFSIGGIPEAVEHGVNGLLANGHPPDVDGLADTFVTYFRSESMRRAHGAAGRARVVAEFDSRPHAQRVQREIERAVSGP